MQSLRLDEAADEAEDDPFTAKMSFDVSKRRGD